MVRRRYIWGVQLWFWIWLGLVLKLPVVWLCWFVYKTINDVPEQVLGEDDGGQPVAVVYGQGPRTRGPNGGLPLFGNVARRKDVGHDENANKSAPIAVASASTHGPPRRR